MRQESEGMSKPGAQGETYYVRAFIKCVLPEM